MSDHSTPVSTEKVGASCSRFWGFVLPLLGFLIFAVFSFLLARHLSSLPSEDDLRAAERMKILSEFKKAEADKEGCGYGWVDSANKVVRVPIDRAMDIVLTELQNKPVGPAYPIGGSRPAANAPMSAPAPAGAPVPAPAANAKPAKPQ